MLSVQVDLRAAFLGNADLRALVGENVFPIGAPMGTEGEFIAITRDGYTFERNKMGTHDETAGLVIECFSPDYDKSLQMAETLRTVLLSTRVDGVPVVIENVSETCVAETDKAGRVFFAQVFLVSVGNLRK